MHLYTSLSGKANPLIKQVCPHSLRSVFFTNILPRGNLIIHLQLEEIMACWEWVGVGALFTCLESCFCCGVFVFFFFQFHQWIKLWEEVFRKPMLYGGMGLCSRRVCFLQGFSLPLPLTQAGLSLFSFPSIPFPHCFTFFIFHSFYILASYSSVTLLSVITHFFLFFILSTAALVSSPFSPFCFFYPPISPAHHIMRNRLDSLLGLLVKSTMLLPGWTDMIWYYRQELEISKRGYCGTLRFLALPQGIKKKKEEKWRGKGETSWMVCCSWLKGEKNMQSINYIFFGADFVMVPSIMLLYIIGLTQ